MDSDRTSHLLSLFFITPQNKRVFFALLPLTFIGFFFPLSLSAQGQEADTISQEQFMSLNERLEYSSSLVFFDGMKAFILEEYDKAAKKFAETLRYSPQNDAAHYLLAQCYANKGEFSNALPHARQATLLDENNPYYFAFLAAIAQELYLFEEAERCYKKILDIAPKLSEDYYFELVTLYLDQNQYKNALDILNLLESRLGIHERAISQKQLLYFNLGKTEAAFAEGEKLVEAFPNEPRYQLAQIELLLRSRQLEKAKVYLAQFDKDFPNNGEAHYLRTKIYGAQGDEAGELTALAALIEADDLPVEEKVNLLIEKFRNQPKSEKGLALAASLAAQYPQAAPAQAVYGDFLFQANQWEESRQAYLRALENNPDNYTIWERVIDLAFREKNYQQAQLHCEEALSYFPNQPQLWYFQALAFYQQKQPQEALESLAQAERLTFEDKILLSRVQTQKADILYQMQDYAQAFQVYEKALNLHSTNYAALNNYSYYLALQKTNLKRAKELSSRLVELFPQEATYLDTHAWVLYTLGEYQAALPFLEKAALQNPSPDILEHYGDLLYQLDRKEEAILQWKKAKEALEKDPKNTKNSAGLDKKLAEGKLVE
ncbi:tetratricopeptide repeat protein [Hugenholtzia roseola]|uniref:tetratricopeptide repeat protein n=1 Tax=Hugenholtzia roseola TaxID=1002 RepID=UPI0004106FEC|nr:tetratricopeptide repeat protein [Hugenholtzia roseola]